MAGIASRSQLRMSFLRYALFTVPAGLVLGRLPGLSPGAGAGNPWFDSLVKPALMPPGRVFGVAWTILYILLGLSLAMILHARGARDRRRTLILFALLLALTFAWPPVFFVWHQLTTALSLIAGMIVLTVGLIFLIWRIRIAAALLLYPYLGWLMFATALSWPVMALNPSARALVPARPTLAIPLNRR